MKTKLLRKARKLVLLVNYHGEKATSKDKLVVVERFFLNGMKQLTPTVRRKTGYLSFSKASAIRRNKILEVAKELNKKSKIWHVFH